MTKPKLKTHEFVAKMNEYLRQDPDYQPGMDFKVYRPGSTGRDVSGICYAPGTIHHPAHDRAEKKTHAEFELDLY